METGSIVIVSFPFTDFTSFKARPAVVITQTADFYQDLVLSMISSVVPETLNNHQMLLQPSAVNNLKAPSIIKVSRIATVEKSRVLATIGQLENHDYQQFRRIFHSLIK